MLPLEVQGDDPGAVYFGVHRAPVVQAAAGWIAIVGIPLDTVPGTQAARWQTPAAGDADVNLDVCRRHEKI